MNVAASIDRANGLAARFASWLESPLLLALRVYVAWQFLKSGWLKITGWESTL